MSRSVFGIKRIEKWAKSRKISRVGFKVDLVVELGVRAVAIGLNLEVECFGGSWKDFVNWVRVFLYKAVSRLAFG